MIIVELRGGLGNQLFQFAYGFHLANKRKTRLLLDTSHFINHPLRNFELDKLGLSKYVGNQEEIKAIKKYVDPRRLHNKICNLVLPYYRHSLVRERAYHFDPNLLKVRKNVYLSGFWQSEKYFSDDAERLLEAIRFEQVNHLAPIKEQIVSSHSVGVHIRRGDYASDPQVKALHGLVPMEYYERAIEFLRNEIPDLSIFVVTDDPAWVTDNFKVGSFEVLSGKHTRDSVDDLYLFSLCQYNVTANSSFSWWGAWLNQNKNKKVICPKNWFAAYADKFDTKDLIPDSWIKM